MMKEESTAINLISYLLFAMIYKDKLNYYENYENAFIKAVNNLFIMNPNTNDFTKRYEFKKQPLSDSKIGLSMISKLFNSISEKAGNYHEFFVLDCIASSFPFLFENHFQQIIDSILPVLDEILFYLSIQDSEDLNEIIKSKNDDEKGKEMKEIKIKIKK